MKKRYWAAIGIIIAAAIGIGAQNGFNSGAYFVNPTTLGNLPMCNQFVGGLCVYSPSGLVDNGTILTYKGNPVSVASSPQTVVITAGDGLDPTHGGTAICATSLGFACNSTYGSVLVTYGTTPADGPLFSINWSIPKTSKPIVTSLPMLTATITDEAAWVPVGYFPYQDVDDTTTTSGVVYQLSATESTLATQQALISYHVDP